ncbi:aminopeptidase [Fournierella massiliensis]|nr:aminopeptidase [Fournierella massiliensis]MCF2557111.1 aminopeptidase [Fournierella massiliensis]
MSKEKTAAQKLQEELFYTTKPAVDADPESFEKASEFCKGYMAFLDAAKTEREAAKVSEKMLQEAGYQPFEPDKTYPAGAKVYFINRHKCVLAATIGRLPLEKGFHLNIAHVDSPRLDLKPNPLYEDGGLALFKTHYYGGLRKYQWATIPLALHGVIYRQDGNAVELRLGEEEGDPVFCITDLLPHLSAEQNKRPLKEGLKGEELNLVAGSLPIEDQEIKERVKLAAMKLLHEQYGITEKDFIRAELEVVPAQKAREVGFDRALIGAYGHDDRVDAYPALMAEIGVKDPAFTTVCVLTDKEETGSDGNTGLQSDYVFNFLEQLCRCQGADKITAFKASKCLSADVTAAFDPTFPSVSEKRNCAFAGKGITLQKYTGSGGKYSTNDASAEMMAYMMDLLDGAGVAWQTGELGKVDEGGGGTVAKYVSKRDIDTVDIGVPVLSMHAPFEMVSKLDVYMAWRTFDAFNRAEK